MQRERLATTLHSGVPFSAFSPRRFSLERRPLFFPLARPPPQFGTALYSCVSCITLRNATPFYGTATQDAVSSPVLRRDEPHVPTRFLIVRKNTSVPLLTILYHPPRRKPCRTMRGGLINYPLCPG